MKLLIIGGGGREHALAWKMSHSSLVEEILVAPGNAGTALESKTRNVAIKATDIQGLLTLAKEEKIDLTIVGPEAPLALGIVNTFIDNQLLCFGPTQEAAQLESSKAYSKAFMQKYHIPTASYAEFNAIEPALAYIENHEYPLVIKADGLAAGKGVVIAQDKAQAQDCIHAMLNDLKFGDASQKIIIEDFLEGEEASFIVISDGNRYIPLATSQDHKARDDGDKGPNTGGMGAYSPAPRVTPELHHKIMQQVIEPTLIGMKDEGHPFVGFLYAGLMIDSNDNIKVLEFNCRFGDPETQPILMRLRSDLAELCLNASQGQLNDKAIKWDKNPALCVVLTEKGYPLTTKTHGEITGIPKDSEHSKTFHAATLEKEGKLVTNGGRVLGVTTKAATLEEAQQLAYEIADTIHCQYGFHYRRDIGNKALS